MPSGNMRFEIKTKGDIWENVSIPSLPLKIFSPYPKTNLHSHGN